MVILRPRIKPKLYDLKTQILNHCKFYNVLLLIVEFGVEKIDNRIPV